NRRGNAQAPELVHRARARTPAVGVIGVLAAREAEFVARFEPRLVNLRELVPAVTPDAYRAGVAVVRLVAEIEVAFEAFERREHLLPRPFGVSFSRPAVI